jgi:sigma-E factor negative regulatory protein RseA
MVTNNLQYERFSQAVDGEADRASLDAAIDGLLSDPAAREQWLSAHRIGDALRFGAPSSLDDTAFLKRFSARLAHVPNHLPVTATVMPIRPVTSSRRIRQLVPLALAASVAFVSWSFWPGAKPIPPEAVATAPDSQPVAGGQPVTTVAALGSATPEVTAAPLDYLIAHQQFAPSNRMQGMAAYARTASVAAPSVLGAKR